jgi:hypothetical protein
MPITDEQFREFIRKNRSVGINGFVCTPPREDKDNIVLYITGLEYEGEVNEKLRENLRNFANDESNNYCPATEQSYETKHAMKLRIWWD